MKWKGRKGSSSRTLAVTLIDDDGYKHARSGIDVEQGHQCIFSYDGVELFRGIIMSQTQSNQKKLQFTAYDNGIYLANNKDTFCYENKTASDVFRDCCTRFGLPMGEVASCSYKIPELTKSKTTAFDAIADALSLDLDATGIRHYVASSKGKLSLLTRRENILQWVIEVGQNITSYSYSRSIEDIKTRVKMVSKEGTTVAEKSNAELEKKIGIFQEIDQPDESLTTAQVNDLIESIMEEKGTPERTLTVEAMGIAEVISGIGVYIIIPELEISRTFYVDIRGQQTHDVAQAELRERPRQGGKGRGGQQQGLQGGRRGAIQRRLPLREQHGQQPHGQQVRGRPGENHADCQGSKAPVAPDTHGQQHEGIWLGRRRYF